MTLSAGVLQTLTYSDHFHFPLKLEEIQTRLYFHKSVTTSKLKLALDTLLKEGIIQKQGNYYFLKGHSSYIKERVSNLQHSLVQLQVAKDLATKIHKISGVQAIYLTGSLAVLNSKTPSDIDFMIITKPARLWTTRFLLTIYTSVLGIRRAPDSIENAGKLCLNLYLTPMSYELPIHKQSLYTAYELIQAVPLYDPSDTQSSLLASNSWIRDYLPNFTLPNPKPNPPAKAKANLLELLLYKLQYLYMHNKITREYITLQSAFFHPKVQNPKVFLKLS